MKKFLSLWGSFSLLTVSSAMVISCSNQEEKITDLNILITDKNLKNLVNINSNQTEPTLEQVIEAINKQYPQLHLTVDDVEAVSITAMEAELKASSSSKNFTGTVIVYYLTNIIEVS